jgi:anthranilate phosphoribosyltransferase
VYGPPNENRGTGDNPELVRCVGEITRAVLAGEGGAPRNATLLGAAIILKASGRALTLAEGVDLATAALDGGGARDVLARLREAGK